MPHSKVIDRRLLPVGQLRCERNGPGLEHAQRSSHDQRIRLENRTVLARDLDACWAMADVAHPVERLYLSQKMPLISF